MEYPLTKGRSAHWNPLIVNLGKKVTDFQSARMASKHIVTTRNENHTSHVTQRSFFGKKKKKKKIYKKRVKKAFFWKNGKKNTLLR